MRKKIQRVPSRSCARDIGYAGSMEKPLQEPHVTSPAGRVSRERKRTWRAGRRNAARRLGGFVSLSELSAVGLFVLEGACEVLSISSCKIKPLCYGSPRSPVSRTSPSRCCRENCRPRSRCGGISLPAPPLHPCWANAQPPAPEILKQKKLCDGGREARGGRCRSG